MNHTDPAFVATDDFGHSLAGIVAAIAVALVLAACAWALHTWPAQTLPWIAAAFVAWLGFGPLRPARTHPPRHA